MTKFTHTYSTGRQYNGPQYLFIECDVPLSGDSFDEVSVQFKDPARNIEGTVSLYLMQLEAYPNEVARTVLALYDAGRYTLA